MPKTPKKPRAGGRHAATPRQKPVSRRTQKTPPSPAPWLLLGMLLGASIMYAVMTLSSIPFLSHSNRIEANHPRTASQKEDAIETHFVFDYPDKLTEELPVYDSEIPAPEPQAPATTPTVPSITKKDEKPPENTPINMVIQVGSFKNFSDADKMKARLAMLGIVADIQRVYLDRNNPWYRVRVERISNLRDLDTIRKRLKKNDINHFVFKVVR